VGVSSRNQGTDVCKPPINCIRSLPRKRIDAFGAKNNYLLLFFANDTFIAGFIKSAK